MPIWFDDEIGPFFAVAKADIISDSYGVLGSDFEQVVVEIVSLVHTDPMDGPVTKGDIEYAKELIADQVWLNRWT